MEQSLPPRKRSRLKLKRKATCEAQTTSAVSSSPGPCSASDLSANFTPIRLGACTSQLDKAGADCTLFTVASDESNDIACEADCIDVVVGDVLLEVEEADLNRTLSEASTMLFQTESVSQPPVSATALERPSENMSEDPPVKIEEMDGDEEGVIEGDSAAFFVVGRKWCDGKCVGKGEIVSLCRDKENKSDDYAILILNSELKGIGYIPRFVSESVCALLESLPPTLKIAGCIDLWPEDVNEKGSVILYPAGVGDLEGEQKFAEVDSRLRNLSRSRTSSPTLILSLKYFCSADYMCVEQKADR